MSALAYRIESEGGGLVRTELPIPQPGHGQVLLRNLATAVNFHDILNLQGVLPNLACPRVPFSDNCGEIVALGPEVKGLAIGQRVIAAFFPDWLDGEPTPARLSTCYGDQIDGFLQTHTLAKAHSLVPAPEGLTPVEAATLGCAGATAWRSVVEEAAVRPGQSVLVQGTGGVSLFALQIAKMAGARAILISSSDEKLALGRDLGADELINYRFENDWDERVIELTDGGADIVVEIGGADTFQKSLNAVKIGGHVSVIGVRSGFGKSVPFPAEQVLMKNIAVKGVTVGSVQTLRDFVTAYGHAKLSPVVHRKFALDEAEAGLDLMQGQGHVGKIVIEIAG